MYQRSVKTVNLRTRLDERAMSMKGYTVGTYVYRINYTGYTGFFKSVNQSKSDKKMTKNVVNNLKSMIILLNPSCDVCFSPI